MPVHELPRVARQVDASVLAAIHNLLLIFPPMLELLIRLFLLAYQLRYKYVRRCTQAYHVLSQR
jgi:hypothetical protein